MIPLVLQTRFANYRLADRRGLGKDDLARAVHAFELRGVLAQWLEEEAWPRSGLRELCDRLDLPAPRMHCTEAERSELIDRAARALESLGGPVLLKEPRARFDRRLHAPEPVEEHGPASDEVHWIEVVILDQDDQPAAGVAYEIKLGDGRVRTGRTNENGVLRYDAIAAGTCELRLVETDAGAWERA